MAQNGPAGILASLQTLHADAINGYEAALGNAAADLMPFLRRLIAIHREHSERLSAALQARGVTPDPDGSWLTYVHETVLSVRGLLGPLDASLIPSLIDGEQRIVSSYQDAMVGEDAAALTQEERELLLAQRLELEAAVDQLKMAV